MEIPQADFNQAPQWDPNADFTIKGYELLALYDFIEQFRSPVMHMDAIMARGVAEEKIKIVSTYKDGTPVPPEKVKEFEVKVQAYYTSRLEPKPSV